MKTLANCPLSEFLPAAYRLREAFHKYYHLIDMDGMRQRYGAQYAAAGEDGSDAVTQAYIGEIMQKMMLTHAEDTVGIIAMLGCMSRDDAEKLPPDRALGIVTECLRSERIMDFFISLERSAGNGTEGILRTLILLRRSVSVTDTSENASPSSTNGNSGDSSLQNTSANA